MLLTIDIGNSRIKCGLFDDNDLSESCISKSTDEVKGLIRGKKIDAAIISSVVPTGTSEVKKVLNEKFNIDPFILTKDAKFNLEIDYKTPGTLGIDRLCSAEGAFFLYKKMNENFPKKSFIVTVDFGSATTINLISSPGKFIGGSIAPGVEMMFEALNKNTAQLPMVNIRDYKSMIGKSTNSSIASGVINSTSGLIEKVLIYLKKEFRAEEIKIFITGGNAKEFLPHLNFKFDYVDNLVLYGIKAVYDLNK